MISVIIPVHNRQQMLKKAVASVLAQQGPAFELLVVDTPPQVKGATATNQLKEAVCEGGAKIKVPPFVENGTKVNVDTRTGEYLGRA